MTGAGQISVESSPSRSRHQSHQMGFTHKLQQVSHGSLPPVKYQEMSPEVTLVEFISTSAAFHGVKRQNIKQLEWDILKVFPNNIMPANAAAWYMAKRRFYMANTYEYQLLPFLLKNYPKKFAVKGNSVEFLETYTKEVARKKMQQMIKQGLLAYFTHKVDEYGVYFFDPYYYETTEPFHANFRLVTNSHAAHRSKLLPNFFAQHQNAFVYQPHSPYLVTISKQPVEVKINTVGIIVSMVDNQFGIIQFPSGTATEKAFFSAKSLFRDGWLYQGDPMKLPPMEFDGYRVPNLGSSASHSSVSTGAGKDPAAKGDYTWYAVLVWCGRKPSPKYCATKEDLTSSPYFQSNQNVPGLPLGNVLQHQSTNPSAGGVSFEELSSGQQQHGNNHNNNHHKGKKHGNKNNHANNNNAVNNHNNQKGACMQVGEVLSIRKSGAVVSLGKDSDEKAFIPGWSHHNLKYKGSFLTTTQGVELAFGDLITFCVDPHQPEIRPFKFVGCNVTVLKHADDKNKCSLSATSSATLLPAGDASSSSINKDDRTNGKKVKNAKKGKKGANDEQTNQRQQRGGRKRSEANSESNNEKGDNNDRKSKNKRNKNLSSSSSHDVNEAYNKAGGAKKNDKKPNKERKKSESKDGKKRERGPRTPYYLKYLLAPVSPVKVVETEQVEGDDAAIPTIPAETDPKKPGSSPVKVHSVANDAEEAERIVEEARKKVEENSRREEEGYDSDVDPSFVPPASHDPDLDYDEYSDGEIPDEELEFIKKDARSEFTEAMQLELRQKLDDFEKKEKEEEEAKTAAETTDGEEVKDVNEPAAAIPVVEADAAKEENSVPAMETTDGKSSEAKTEEEKTISEDDKKAEEKLSEKKKEEETKKEEEGDEKKDE